MKKLYTLPPKWHRWLAAFWIVCALIMALILAWVLPSAHLNSSVLALLPPDQHSQVPAAINQAFMNRIDRQVVWMISPGTEENPAPAQWWLNQLKKGAMLETVEGPITAEKQQAWGTFFFKHRHVLLDDDTRQRLLTNPDEQANWVMSQVYSAFAGVSGQELAHDPLLLTRSGQLALQKYAGRLQMRQGWLTAQDTDGRLWYFIHGTLRFSSYNTQQSQAFIQKLSQLKSHLQTQWPNTATLERGVVFYSAHAVQEAKQDISHIGIITVLGILALIFITFRSVRPLLLCALSVGMGALAGTTTTLLAFGEIHLLTLIMSLSIIGLSVDYTLYYLTERLVHGQESSAQQSLNKVLPALSMALITTVVAYLVILIAPFPGIQQLGVFASAGLTAACLTVLFWHPYLVNRLPTRPTPFLWIMLRWLSAWRNQLILRWGLPVLFLMFSIIGGTIIKTNDDISQLQALPTTLQQQEQKITQLTGQGLEQKWFVVTGDSPQSALQRLETFTPLLEKAQKAGWLSQYRPLPLPSLTRQQENQRLLEKTTPAVLAILANRGLSLPAPDLKPEWVNPQTWLHSPVSQGWDLLWASLPNGQTGILVPVDGATHPNQLAELAQQTTQVFWVDRKGSLTTSFTFYRHVLTLLIVIALAGIAVSYMVRYGVKRGLINTLPSLLSLGSAIGALAVFGYTLNLFALLALVLILGIGINYTLFFSNPHGTPTTSLLAISLAMSTTLLTLGMLVFSHTPVIQQFGIALCSGIITAFLLSPLAIAKRRQHV